MINLSEIAKSSWIIIRDGTFESLGLCNAKPDVPILTFCGENKFLLAAMKNPFVSCMMISENLANSDLIQNSEKGICVVQDLRKTFFSLHNALCEEPYTERYCGKPFPTVIGQDCRIDARAIIAERNVIIGSRVEIEPNVNIFENVSIGDDSIIRAGTVLGGTGLEFIRLRDETLFPVTHRGSLKIGEAVEIQYNCNISRSLFPWHSTIIGDGTKIESLVHIAHGVHIGKHGLIAGSACIAGSAILGDDVWVGPNATISSEIRIGNRACITLGSVVASNVASGKTVTGNFAIDHDRFINDLMKKIL